MKRIISPLKGDINQEGKRSIRELVGEMNPKDRRRDARDAILHGNVAGTFSMAKLRKKERKTNKSLLPDVSNVV
ncbi:MAG: hypothetical protein QNK37_28595 [Acidobacteriota bacterium]|nr:hypothetical protein [Acidobacteriota bacterium]